MPPGGGPSKFRPISVIFAPPAAPPTDRRIWNGGEELELAMRVQGSARAGCRRVLARRRRKRRGTRARPMNDPSSPRRRSWVLLVAALGATVGLTCLPFIDSFLVDDWIHFAVLDGTLSQAQGLAQSAPWDLFRFDGGDPEVIQLAKESSTSPWFTHPELKLAFWRPISSLLMALDHRLFGMWVPGYILHSIVWYAGLSAIVATLFLRVFPERIGVLSAVIFAVLGTHHQSVVWPSARNSLVCACLGGTALLAHLEARETGYRGGKLLAVGLLGLALLAGEAALGMAGFVLAYELVGNRDSVRARVLHLLPVVGVVLAWLVVYVLHDYGTHGSGEYINPIDAPWDYLRAFPERMGNALSVLFAGAPADIWFLAPGVRTSMAILGALSTLVMAPWLWSVAKKLSPDVRRHLAWLTLGMVLAVLPQLAGVLGPRSFLVPSLGSAAIVGVLIVSAFKDPRFLPKAGAFVLLTSHGLLGVGTWVGGSALYSRIIADAEANYRAMGLHEESAANRSYVVISAAEVFSGFYAPFQFAAENRIRVGSWTILSLCECDHTLTRLSERTFEVTLDGHLLSSPFAALIRSPRQPPKLGERVRLTDMTIEVSGTNDQAQPTRFSVELMSPTLPEFWAWSDGSMERFSLPAPGQSRTFRWVPP